MNTVEPDRAQSRRQAAPRDWSVPLLVGATLAFASAIALAFFFRQVDSAELGAKVAFLLTGCLFVLTGYHLVRRSNHVAMLLRIASRPGARPRSSGIILLCYGIGIVAMTLLQISHLLSLPVPTDAFTLAVLATGIIGLLAVGVVVVLHID